MPRGEELTAPASWDELSFRGVRCLWSLQQFSRLETQWEFFSETRTSLTHVPSTSLPLPRPTRFQQVQGLRGLWGLPGLVLDLELIQG